MTIHAFTDGASRGNPGHAGIGVILKDETGTVIVEEKKYLGKVTNNVAEYSALISCLEKVHTLLAEKKGFTCSKLVVHSDSELMVRQLNGVYKIKNLALKKIFGHVQDALRSARFEFSIKHISRERNREADALANESIDEQLR
jgi:ribonuclease HI